MSTPLLQVAGLSVVFGGILALQDVSLDVTEREICGLIGPNGAGKTTLFNAISRICPVDAGTIRLAGRDVTRLSADRVIGLGVARTFQNLGLFPALTVLDNVLLGAHHRIQPGFLSAILANRAAIRRDIDCAEEAMAVLGDLGLADVAGERTSSLAFGTQKRIELARALMARPRLLMLDEPANGLSHSEVHELGDTILSVRERYRIAILLVEHHMRMVMRLSERVAVLDNGRKIADGTPDEVRANRRVIEAYLGAPA